MAVHREPRWLLWTIIMLAATAPAISQSTLTGKITDSKTGEPVPFANVFFAHTTRGTSSLVDGTFTISRIPDGKYDLVVEVIGYRHHKQPVEFNEGPYRLDIVLEPDIVQLDSVTVIADQSDKRYYPVFVRFFVGDTRSAKTCKILNPEVLHFYFDTKRRYLTVTARKPVQILNPELGYLVHFSLDRFGLDFETGGKVMMGSPRFEELKAVKRRDSIAWAKKRNQAYRGSVFHFMRSLYLDELDKEGFNLSLADSADFGNTWEETLRPFRGDSLVTIGKVAELHYRGLMKLEFRASEDWEYPGRAQSRYRGRNPKGYQQTYLRLKGENLRIYENGYFSDQETVYMTGYLVWRETVSAMVPLGHEVVKKTGKRKKKNA